MRSMHYVSTSMIFAARLYMELCFVWGVSL